MNKAVEFLGQLKGASDKLEDNRLFFTKPLNDQVKAINARFKELRVPIEMTIDSLKTSMLFYRRAKEEERLAEEKKIREAQEAEAREKARLQHASQKKAVEALPEVVVEKQATTVVAESGSKINVRKIKKFRIIDEKSIPKKYLIIDLKAIDKDVKSGIEIKGVEVYEEEQIATYGN
jgi:hypothetical protein